jgi:hypothetical protein
MKRKEGRTSERVEILGLYLQRENHGEGTHEKGSEEGKQVVGWVWGIGERKWGGDFRRRMMMFESIIESIEYSMFGAEISG